MDGISIIVLTKDRPDLFLQCARSIPARPFVVERIVVQHGTDEETVRIAEASGWRVVGDGRNRSYSAGNNLAASGAAGSHLLLLNNDARLDEGCLDALWRRRAHPLVGCLILDRHGRVNHAGIAYNHKSFLPVHIGNRQDRSTVTGDRYAPSATFAAAMIEKRLWDALGGLSEDYWYSFEDVDFCLRAHERGVRVLVAHDAVVYHDESSTRQPAAVDPGNLKVWRARWIRTRRLADALGLTEDD